MFLDYFALFIMIAVFLILVYAAIYIHDIPYELAKKRNHPHQDAIHAGGWVSLFTLHAIWPFLWIWASLYRPETGYGFGGGAADSEQQLSELKASIDKLQERIAVLEKRNSKEGEA